MKRDELPRPKKGDVLFTYGDDWPNNACLNYVKGADAWGLYSVGYRAGAERLAEYVIDQHREQDTLIYPIVFLWRHYVELRLKGLLDSARQLTDQPLKANLDHKVLALWQKLRPLLEAIEPNADTETLDAVEEIVSQFDQVDTDSFAFRYPLSKKGIPSLPSELYHINIRNLTEVMQRVGSFLDSADIMLDVYLEHKAEMESYYPDEY